MNNQFFDGFNDVGEVKFAGSWACDDAGVIRMTGAGFNMWGTKDAFFFMWKKVTGDFEIAAKFAFEGEGVNPHRKVGFMVRESMDPGSRYVDLALHGDGLTAIQYRTETDGETWHTVSAHPGQLDVRMSRCGNKYLFDDITYELDLPETCYVGLFICSHEEDLTETAYVRDLSFSSK